jgi:hypothetical protein
MDCDIIAYRMMAIEERARTCDCYYGNCDRRYFCFSTSDGAAKVVLTGRAQAPNGW